MGPGYTVHCRDWMCRTVEVVQEATTIRSAAQFFLDVLMITKLHMISFFRRDRQQREHILFILNFVRIHRQQPAPSILETYEPWRHELP